MNYLVPLLIIGLIVLLVSVLIGYKFWYYHNKIKPKEYIGLVGIKYGPNTIKPYPGINKVIDLLTIMLSEKYGKFFAQEILSKIWIEIVGANDKRITLTTTVSEENKIAGSVDFVSPPFSNKTYYVAVVLQREKYKTADDSAIFHEVCKHILPIYLGKGFNQEHSIPEFNKMEKDLHNMFKKEQND